MELTAGFGIGEIPLYNFPAPTPTIGVEAPPRMGWRPAQPPSLRFRQAGLMTRQSPREFRHGPDRTESMRFHNAPSKPIDITIVVEESVRTVDEISRQTPCIPTVCEECQ